MAAKEEIVTTSSNGRTLDENAKSGRRSQKSARLLSGDNKSPAMIYTLTAQQQQQQQEGDGEDAVKGYQPVEKPYNAGDEAVAAIDAYELWRRQLHGTGSKNKLKRKKNLSASLTSVSDTVSQEKRTRIEAKPRQQQQQQKTSPVDHSMKTTSAGAGSSRSVTTTTPRIKHKLHENVQTIQKLNALADQLRLEINELKSSLLTERGAVRTLRAKNETELRRWKSEVKRLQHVLQLTDAKKPQRRPNATSSSSSMESSMNSTTMAASKLVNYEIQKLINEISVLKDANRNFYDKKLINGDADRRKAADMRTLRDSYEIRLTQVQKSAKIEITRLLEELKSKERNIGLLKKDLRILQNSRQQNSPNGCKKNAMITTKNETNKTTTTNKPKKPLKKSTSSLSSTTTTTSSSSPTAAVTEATERPEAPSKDTKNASQAQITDEITKLKDIEPNSAYKSSQMLFTSTSSIDKTPRIEENYLGIMTPRHHQGIRHDENCHKQEYHSLPHKIAIIGQDLLKKNAVGNEPEPSAKDNNSDSDSALSSAPPSISPQPPANGIDSTDIWQTIRTYAHETERLQKLIDALQKDNQGLREELNFARDELVISESNANEANKNAKRLPDLIARLKSMEEHEHQLAAEANELREQNELLEFRIIELEETSDKWTLRTNNNNNNCRNVSSPLSDRDAWSSESSKLDALQTLVGQDLALQLEQNQCEIFTCLQNLLTRFEMNVSDRKSLQFLQHFMQQIVAAVSQNGSDNSEHFSEVHTRLPTENSNNSVNQFSLFTEPTPRNNTQQLGLPNTRIIATVQPYNSNSAQTPTNGNNSARKSRTAWLNNSSLSESGVFLETDPFGSCVRHACAQTDASFNPNTNCGSTDLSRLRYYQERLELLERKVLIYESSGEQQAKHLADRLQREIQLEKELKELIDRVDYLEQQNLELDEEKCEFEEAENDTRLRLQRLELELEIVGQRNVEIELSKETLNAKYKDCRAECLVLREDLANFETQLRNLERFKQTAEKHLQTHIRLLPLLLLFKILAVVTARRRMGNQAISVLPEARSSAGNLHSSSRSETRNIQNSCNCAQQQELLQLRDEVKKLRHQLKDVKSRHFEAMETADTHWADQEREYKLREDAYRTKEMSLKQKICKLQDCLREDARAAEEKIQQLEETEHGLKCCLMRISKEHKELSEEVKCLRTELDEHEKHDEITPLTEALESEKRRNKTLNDELNFLKKLQESSEAQAKQETDTLRAQLSDCRKEYLYIEVTNGELKEEVLTLETHIAELQRSLKEHELKTRELQDELRTKEELVAKLESRPSYQPPGYSLAEELRQQQQRRSINRDEVKDLKTASMGLANAIQKLQAFEKELPAKKQFEDIALDVKKMADLMLAKTAVTSDEQVLELQVSL